MFLLLCCNLVTLDHGLPCRLIDSNLPPLCSSLVYIPRFETSLALHVMHHTLASTLLPENGPTALRGVNRMFVVQVAYAPITSVSLTYLKSYCLPQPKLILVPEESSAASEIALLRIPNKILRHAITVYITLRRPG